MKKCYRLTKSAVCLIIACALLLCSCSIVESGADNKDSRVDLRPSIERFIFKIGDSTLYMGDKSTQIKPPYTVNDTTLVPVRVITEGLGASVEWDGQTQGVTIDKGDVHIELAIGRDSAWVNGAEKQLLCAPELNDDTTMVPVRLISEALGMEVIYDEVKDSVVVVRRAFDSLTKIDESLVDSAKKFVLDKTAKNAPKFGEKFPHGTKNGIYEPGEPGWVGGFYTGLNYLCYDFCGDTSYIDNTKIGAEKLKKLLYEEPEIYHHDLGFTFLLSYYQDYLLTGSEESKNVVIKAGDVLMARADETVGYIRGWNVWGKNEYARNNQYRMIVDSMCNIPLLFVCTELTGDKKYEECAIRHARLTQQYLIRNNYTSPHTFVFSADGTPRFEQTHQGASDKSCWSRGQAWIINGMAYAYAKTGDKSFLDTSKNCIDTYLLKTEKDLIPTWDLDFQGMAVEPRDSSAAGIIACGMCQIYDETGDAFYYEAAKRIFKTLYEKYSTKNDDKNEGLILHATGHKPANQNIDVSLIYGDYYFAELLGRIGDKVLEK